MKVDKTQLYNKMIVTPRLNLKCDGVKMKCVYSKNEHGSGWLIKNLDNDGLLVWYKSKLTHEIVNIIFEKYKDVNITWSRSC